MTADAWRSRRSVKVAVAAAALLLFIAGLLARVGGPIQADVTENVRLTARAGPLSTDQVLRQGFVAHANELTSVTMRFATDGGVRRCAVGAQLTSAGAVISSNVLPCSAIPDSKPVEVFRFPAQPHSDGRTYEIDLKLSEAGGDAPLVWAGIDGGGRLPAAEFAGDTLPATLELHTFYGGGGRAWEQIGLALRRLSQYRPWFQQPVAVVFYAVLACAALLALVVVRGRRALAVLIVLALSKGLLWSAIVPPLEAPDEPAHVAYAQFMAETHRIPKRDVYQLGLPPSQQHSPQLEEATRVLHQESEPRGDRPDFPPRGDPRVVHAVDQLPTAANGSAAAAGYPPVYYFPAAVLYELSPGSLVHRIEAMRVWSIALGAIAAWLTLLIGRRLFRRCEPAAIALAVACLVQPELSQQTAVVNNDALVIAAGTACLLAALDLTRPSGRRSRWLCGLAGAALGIAMFKSFGVIFAPVLLVAWVIGRARTRKPERIPFRREIGQTVAGLGLTLGAWMAYAAAFGFHGASLADITPGQGPKDLRSYLHLLRRNWFREIRVNWVDQLWGNFSNVNTPFPTWVQGTILVITLLTMALVVAWAAKTGLTFLRARRSREPGAGDEEDADNTADVVVCVAAIAATFAFFLIAGYLNYHRTGRNDLIQGRYALMLLPAIVALPALTLRTLRPRINLLVPTLGAAAALVMLNIGGVALVVERFYL